jgi:hypothetical protein
MEQLTALIDLHFILAVDLIAAVADFPTALD